MALAGNPNCGKTSIFNGLTGARYKVANYPGVTVEKREGRFRHAGADFQLLDLPGTYSLSSWSPEERIATRELVGSRHTVTVVVAEASSLSRSLLLLGQVMQLDANPVLCLNMWDEFRASGARLDLPLLSRLLGVPVVTTVGHLGQGLDELRTAIARAAEQPVSARQRLVLGDQLDQALREIAATLTGTPLAPRVHAWMAEKLLTGDEECRRTVHQLGAPGAVAVETAGRWRERLETESGLDIGLYVAGRYHGFVDGLLRRVLRHPPRINARVLSDRIDSVLVHPMVGVPIFFLAMYGLFWMAFRLGEIPMGWIEAGFGWLGGAVSGLWPDGSASLLRSLLVDGVIAGVGGVVVFLPNIILLFLGLSLLENTGYMARAAFLMDRFLHRFGLHGQSFIPLMTGFGCSIPGIMATRTLRNESDRLITIMILPLMSCGARLPIWMLLIPVFFPARFHALALWTIYVVGVVAALGLAVVLRRGWRGDPTAPFVLELPPYRVPTVKAVGLQLFDRARLYLRNAGTLILAVSMVMWAASTFPRPATREIDRQIADGRVVVTTGDPAARPVPAGVTVMTASDVEKHRAAENLEASLTGRLGRLMEPVLKPAGFDWRLGAGLIGAFAAKEVFVAQMGVIYSLGGSEDSIDSLRAALQRDYRPVVGISLILFLLIATPCMATVAVTRRETGAWKWAWLQFWGLTGLGYLLAVLVNQVGRLL